MSRWIWGVVGLYVAMAIVMFDQMEEDAFIYFRVARNLARGHGYVFNAGGEHIECGSSITWQFLLALADGLSLDLPFFAKFCGIALGAATLYLLGLLSARFISSPLLRLVPSLLLALSIPFYYWTQRGLETALYAFSIVLLAVCILDDRWKRAWVLPALLVALTRPEGAIVLAGLAAFLWFERRNRRMVLLGTGVFVGGVLLVEIGRFFYFHDLVPHAFYLKMREPRGIARAAIGLFFEVTNLWAVAAVAGVGLLRRAAWSRAFVTVLVLEAPFFAWALSTHALAINNRHLVPALSLFYLLVGSGLDQLVQRMPPLVHPVAWGTGLFTLWFGLECPAVDLTIRPMPNPFRGAVAKLTAAPRRFASNLGALARARPRVADERNYLSDSITENWQFQVGDFIAKTYPKGITVLYDQMGQTPWYGGLDKTFIDTTGLTYRPTAFLVLNHVLDESRGDAAYFTYRSASEKLLGVFGEPYRRWRRKDAVEHLLGLDPELIIVNAMYVIRTLPDGTEQPIMEHVPGMLYADPRVRERYVEHRKFVLIFLERKDLAARVVWDPRERYLPGKLPALGQGSHQSGG